MNASLTQPPSSHRKISRRHALLTALASGPLACQRARQPPPTAASAAPPGGASGGAAFGGLAVATAGPMRDGERGGVAVVLLHGWGAPGDDLVPLGEVLARPGSRFYMPAAPLTEMGGGRAWWHLDLQRPGNAEDDVLPPDHRPNPEVTAARAAVQAVLRTIIERQAPATLVLGGFSQGAMLSLDVALAASPAVTRVAALSGLLLADSIPALRAAGTAPTRPPVFQAHGRQDQVVPFAAGDRARQLLERHHFAVTWRPFSGGHTIPPEVVRDLGDFLFAPA
jgi:phospholipase/carboxylesterase